MKQENTVKTNIRVSSGLSEYIAPADLICRSKGRVYLQATAKFMLILAITLGGALIPVLHFVIVPIGSIAACYIFISSLQNRNYLKIASVDCPECRSKIEINKINRCPADFACPGCNRIITLYNNF